jgi:hypothetical protein
MVTPRLCACVALVLGVRVGACSVCAFVCYRQLKKARRWAAGPRLLRRGTTSDRPPGAIAVMSTCQHNATTQDRKKSQSRQTTRQKKTYTKPCDKTAMCAPRRRGRRRPCRSRAPRWPAPAPSPRCPVPRSTRSRGSAATQGGVTRHNRSNCRSRRCASEMFRWWRSSSPPPLQGTAVPHGRVWGCRAPQDF